MTVTYDLVLIEYPNGQWSVEPVGLNGVKPGDHVITSDDLEQLLHVDARELVASAVLTDPYTFNLRFLSPEGRLLATSTVTSQPYGKHHRPDTNHEDIVLADELRAKVLADDRS